VYACRDKLASATSRLEAVAGAATPGEAALFQSLWQDRVRTLLLDRADDPDVIVIHNT
jgi:hypothetical protein